MLRVAALIIPLLFLAACATSSDEIRPTPTTVALFDRPTEVATAVPAQAANTSNGEQTPVVVATAVSPSSDMTVVEVVPSNSVSTADFRISIDTAIQNRISPLIYGLSLAPDEILEELQPAFHSWGGNHNSRYNWQLGNAWNAARDWFYQNGHYTFAGESASDDFVESSSAIGATTRIVIPTLGWVAKDNDPESCSFPLANGECGEAGGASCDNPGEIADPYRANIAVDVDFMLDWINHLYVEQGYDVRFLAMDNEPELWGLTHYDVHPECTTYNEILAKYTSYASAIREVLPDVELTGPITCCWYYYWNSAAGRLDSVSHGDRDYLPWFLEQMQDYEDETGVRILDVLDIHYYPEGLYNDDIDEFTAAHRLRSTRSLWDRTYVDESWIQEPVYLIPRMQELIEEYYPGTKFGISEWNFGAEETMNGALAIADALGVFGANEVYFASYWTYPPLNSPGFYAFKMYTNYDGEGAHFGDVSIAVDTDNYDKVSSYASLDSETGKLKIMLINKSEQEATPVGFNLAGYEPDLDAPVEMYHYGERTNGIEASEIQWGDVTLPPYSITLLVLQPSAP